SFAVLIVSPPGYKHSQIFAEVAETLHFGLIALGYRSVITDQILPEHRHIVLGVNLLQFCSVEIPEDSILYNLEQISPDSPWITESMLELFQSYTFWDYSLVNCMQLCLLGCSHVQHVPLGYVPQLTRISPIPEKEKDIDILFYGSPTEKRSKILDELRQKNLNVVQLSGIYGTERDHLIAKSKIVINIHCYEAKVFEIVRVSYLLANRIFVLSEDSPDDPQAQSLQGGVAFAQYENLVETCLYFLGNLQQRKEMSEKGFQLFCQDLESTYLEKALKDAHTPSKDRIRIDLGCGMRKAVGFIGIDINPAPGVDIVADLSKSFPFEDSSIDEVRAHDFIEHLPDRLQTMNEIWRICKDGAIVDLFVPSTDGRGAFQDPTHVSFWNINSFQYFSVEYPHYLHLCNSYGFRGKFSLVSLRQYESPDKVIHVHALLKAIKTDVDEVAASLLSENSINIIIFPDWCQTEEIVFSALKDVIREITLHPESASIALLIETSNFPELSGQTPEALLSYVVMDLLFSEEIDVANSGLDFSFVNLLKSD
ncbi:MAG: methyltransferase domain-containing protein, partial [Thermosynechococcaceae cyanobacterium]